MALGALMLINECVKREKKNIQTYLKTISLLIKMGSTHFRLRFFCFFVLPWLTFILTMLIHTWITSNQFSLFRLSFIWKGVDCWVNLREAASNILKSESRKWAKVWNERKEITCWISTNCTFILVKLVNGPPIAFSLSFAFAFSFCFIYFLCSIKSVHHSFILFVYMIHEFMALDGSYHHFISSQMFNFLVRKTKANAEVILIEFPLIECKYFLFKIRKPE